MFKIYVTHLSQTRCLSSIVFAKKKDVAPRLCVNYVNYRMLNELRTPYTHSIPCMDEFIDSLGISGIFSAIDTNRSYQQGKMSKVGQGKTAYTSSSDPFSFTWMASVLKWLGPFQRAFDVLFNRCKELLTLSYLDNSIFFFQTQDANIGIVR